MLLSCLSVAHLSITHPEGLNTARSLDTHTHVRYQRQLKLPNVYSYDIRLVHSLVVPLERKCLMTESKQGHHRGPSKPLSILWKRDSKNVLVALHDVSL